MASPEAFCIRGYTPASRAARRHEWRDRYFESIRLLAEPKEHGIPAGIDTRTTDVEGEINGLLTYDRRVRKIPAEALREAARTLVERRGGLTRSAAESGR